MYIPLDIKSTHVTPDFFISWNFWLCFKSLAPEPNHFRKSPKPRKFKLNDDASSLEKALNFSEFLCSRINSFVYDDGKSTIPNPAEDFPSTIDEYPRLFSIPQQISDLNQSQHSKTSLLPNREFKVHKVIFQLSMFRKNVRPKQQQM